MVPALIKSNGFTHLTKTRLHETRVFLGMVVTLLKTEDTATSGVMTQVSIIDKLHCSETFFN